MFKIAKSFFEFVSNSSKNKYLSAALGVFIVTLLHNNLHKLASEFRGNIWSASNAGFILFLLLLVCLSYRSVIVWAACGLSAIFAFQALSCNIWYIFDPWPLVADGELCSTKLKMPLSAFGIAASLYVLGFILNSKK